MSLKDTWVDKVDGQNDILSNDINSVAKQAIENEESIGLINKNSVKKEDIFSAEDINGIPAEIKDFPIEIQQIYESAYKIGWNIIFGDKGSNNVDGLLCLVGGYGCNSTNELCFVWASYGRALNDYAVAMGFEPLASGVHSIAMGSIPEATEEHAVAIGNNVQAKSKNQWVRGAYNIPDDTGTYLDIFGNGTYEKRSNAYTLDKDGNGWFSGDVTVGADKKVLATQEYVNDLVGDIESLLGGI